MILITLHPVEVREYCSFVMPISLSALLIFFLYAVVRSSYLHCTITFPRVVTN